MTTSSARSTRERDLYDNSCTTEENVEVFIERVMKALEKRLQHIEERHCHFSRLAESRSTNEKLLQLEILMIISLSQGIEDFLPEKLYPVSQVDGTRRKVDVWFIANEVEYWMEIKMRATNYHRPRGQPSRAITHGTESIIEDYKRLNGLSSAYRKYLLFSYLPVYDDRYHFLTKQLTTLTEETGLEIGDASVRVPLKEVEEGRLEVFCVLVE